ncbi:hypothetical protein GCM10027093_65010 [Paraburkholderia jirisanensis]
MLSLASRHVRPGPLLALDADERQAIRGAAGDPANEAANKPVRCDPERWSVLETLRIVLLLASADLESEGFPGVFEHLFRFADHGECCALYRALPLLPRGERFVWRAGEGCRSNMRTVFEAAACDSPYPAAHFDDASWRQLVIKALFIDVPLSRIHGLDQRLSPELARMALDLADERRSASRSIAPQLWLCLGPHAGERGLQALRHELATGDDAAQRGALLGLARAGALAYDNRSNGSHDSSANNSNAADNHTTWQRSACERHAQFIERARAGHFTQHVLQFV